MTVPKKLARFRPTKGIAYDTPASELSDELYSRGQNVQFRNGFAERIKGSRQVYATASGADTIMRLQNYRPATTNFWIIYGEDEIYAAETSNESDITLSGGLTPVTQPWQWSCTDLNGVAAATNGLDEPIYWGGDVGTPFQALPNFPAATLAKGIIAFKYHLFAFDIDDASGTYRDKVIWSNAAEPGAVPDTWAAAADNEAGDTVLGDTPGPILSAALLRGSLFLFKRSSTYACDYVGGNEVFSFRTMDSARGALTRHAAVNIGDRIFLVTDGDIVTTDGTNWVSVAQGRVKETLNNAIDQDNYENLFCVYNRAKNEVWVCFPEIGSALCTRAFIYDVANDAWGERALVNVACAATGVVNDTDPDESWSAATYTWADAEAARLWNSSNFSLANESLVTATGDEITMHDTADAVVLAASVGKYNMPLVDEKNQPCPERVKLVRRVYVRAQAGFGTLYGRVGASMTPTGDITWSTEAEIVEPAGHFDRFAQGRYISVELRSEDGNVWRVMGFEPEYELRGYF